MKSLVFLTLNSAFFSDNQFEIISWKLDKQMQGFKNKTKGELLA